MNQCQATTSSGTRCRRHVPKGKRYCGHHAGFDWKRVGAMGAGATIGSLIAPGAGTVVGGLVGAVVDLVSLNMKSKKRVFLSFDYRHDRKMKTLFAGQCEHPKTPFEIVDCSLQEAAPEDEWMEHAAEALADADLLVVLLGQHTWKAEGVIAEVEMATHLGVPSVQVWAYRDLRGRPVDGAGRCYPWDWAVLAHVLD